MRNLCVVSAEIVWPLSHAGYIIQQMTVPQTNVLSGPKTPFYSPESQSRTLCDVRLRSVAATFEKERAGKIHLSDHSELYHSHSNAHGKEMGMVHAPKQTVGRA